MMTDRDRNSVASVEKALAILRVVGRSKAPLTVRDIAQATGLSQTTCHRLVRALDKGGALARTDGAGFTVGHLAHELTGAGGAHPWLRAAASGPLLSLRQRSGGETVGLYVPVNGSELMCIESLSGWHEIRHTEVLNRPIPLAKGATSLIFLADLLARRGEAELEHYLSGLPTDARALPIRGLLDLIERTRRSGFAFSSGTRIPGLAALSMPVRGHLDRMVAAVTLSFPAERRPDDLGAWQQALRACAEAIGHRSRRPGAADEAVGSRPGRRT